MKNATTLVTALLLLAAGCGGRPGGSDHVDDAGSGTDASTRDGEDQTHDGAPAPDGARPADGAVVPDGPAAPDGARPVDGGSDAGALVGIQCGQDLCTPGQAFCCVTGSAPLMQCVPVDVVGPHCDFGAQCDGAEDCEPGERCCAPSGAIMQTYCHAGSCPAGRALCHTTDDCGVFGETCCPSVEFGWPHSVCWPGAQCPS